MKVWLLTPDKDAQAYMGKVVEFVRLPAVGEYFTLNATGDWHLTQIVIHTQFEDAKWEAEIWAIPVDGIEVAKPLLDALKTPPDIANFYQDQYNKKQNQ